MQLKCEIYLCVVFLFVYLIKSSVEEGDSDRHPPTRSSCCNPTPSHSWAGSWVCAPGVQRASMRHEPGTFPYGFSVKEHHITTVPPWLTCFVFSVVGKVRCVWSRSKRVVPFPVLRFTETKQRIDFWNGYETAWACILPDWVEVIK